MGDDRVPGTQPADVRTYVCPVCGETLDEDRAPTCPNDGADMDLKS